MGQSLAQFFADHQFQLESGIDLDLVQIQQHAHKKIRLCWYPYQVHCCVFEHAGQSPVSCQQVINYHELTAAYINRQQHPRSRWLRIRVPITVTVILACAGFETAAIAEAQCKQQHQMGNINSILLIDTGARQAYTLARSGLVGGLPLRYCRQLSQQLAQAMQVALI